MSGQDGLTFDIDELNDICTAINCYFMCDMMPQDVELQRQEYERSKRMRKLRSKIAKYKLDNLVD